MKTFDVAIIGSGPSGATAAFNLAKQGISTVIIEKETLPRYKVCGGGLVLRGRNYLPFDISSVVEKEFNSVDLFLENGIHLKAERDVPVVSMIMRDAFDKLIVDKSIELGVTLLQNHKLENITFKEKTILHTNQGDIEAKIVIAADGAYSPTAKLAGWDKETRNLIPALECEVEVSSEDYKRFSDVVRFDVDAMPKGYGWCFPKKNHLSLGVASMVKGKINLKEHYAKYLNSLGVNVISEKQYGFQIPISMRTDGFVKKNVFLIGDAAGFADPITAEGISNAIYSGKIMAESIIKAKLNIRKSEELYLELLNKKLIPELKTGYKLATLFYNQKKVRNMLMKVYGQRFIDGFTDIFLGKVSYPADVTKKIQSKIKEMLFKKS